MKIYLASSWKCEGIVKSVYDKLVSLGYKVDAFCKEDIGRYVFSFQEIENQGIKLSGLNCKTMLEQPQTKRAFKEDKKWIDWCDVCIMLLPCGNSAHLEAGYAKGSGKKLIICDIRGLKKGEFDVMYGFADLITDNIEEILNFLQGKEVKINA